MNTEIINRDYMIYMHCIGLEIDPERKDSSVDRSVRKCEIHSHTNNIHV